jgi:hypothetical protein
MSASKKKRKKTSKKVSTRRLPERESIARWATIGATVVVVGGTALGLTFGVSWLESRAAAQLAGADAGAEFHWDERAPWLPESVRADLLARVAASQRRDPDPFSKRVLGAIGANLETTGWFDRIDEVRRRPGGRIEIDGKWRVPAAVVRHRDATGRERDMLVSSEGALLNLAFDPGVSTLPVISGPQYNPPVDAYGDPAYGTSWGPDVEAGVALAILLRGQPYAGQVGGVDVSEFITFGRLVIMTSFGTRVRWGGAPDVFNPGEVETESKIARLAMLYDRYGRIDGGEAYIEIQGPKVVKDDTARGP